MNSHSQSIKQNFEQKSADYDSFMLKCVPGYEEMLSQLIETIPFSSDKEISICDLGSGTGNVTEMLLENYPQANINCVDISPMMTDMAKAKLNSTNLTFEIADFSDYQFHSSYDVICSSLALHHLVSDEDKIHFYKEIFKALKPNGIFINADVIIGNSEIIEEQQMAQWKDWLRQYHSEDDLMEMVINRYYEEDRPTTIANHMRWMNEVGFRQTDVIWKMMKSVVYCGQK